MARPRNKKNKDLPANLYRGEGKTWRYRHPVTGKFTNFGNDKNNAINAARKLNDLLIPRTDLVGKVIGTISFAKFADDYLENKRRKDGRPIASNSKRMYKFNIERLKDRWPNIGIDEITLLMVNQLLDDFPPSTGKSCRSLLNEIFDLAISKGLREDNPARATITKHTTKQRKRHTLEGLKKVRDMCDPWLQNAIDISMLTTQRRIDILNLKWTDIYDGYLHVAQEKTTDDPEDDFEILEGAGYIRIKIDAELQKVLERCKADNLVSPFIIRKIPDKRGRRNKTPKEHWTQIHPTHLSNKFKYAVVKSQAYPTYTAKQLPTFHEIRALSIFLHKKAGRSAQALAGHTTPAMTDKYASGHEIIWNDVDVGIKLPFA
ncbi:phage integrase Arm DNA-binding domain-containing protein [Acinetobacter corruptisaponis]|uniref:Phage integrase Arm DNA-binding domain-containing protein n=1 Tax=Acinetobacter corruptisaponis TaxID=3045147 RepID=A0ABY8SB23_9GAMM|nr:phage integrase Arm DNA-binding domain-containing protein [Acinetobacter sp. KCTC 92772]WHP06879.1 phage integrase Arm DNA-binding domain-containing protein [Acinetobacter sp. KCTC 92772]